jgi:hypothetical protein
MRMMQNIEKKLPIIKHFKLINDPGFSDYYGAIDVAREYTRCKGENLRCPGMWQHGPVPPWQMIRPELVAFNAAKDRRCFVARRDEVTFLKAGGYKDVEAIGVPIIYTSPINCHRKKSSLLVMPPHTLPQTDCSSPKVQYAHEICKLKPYFRTVVACVSATCYAKGLWLQEFASIGVPVVIGAAINDANALRRMRFLFEGFEYMTTPDWGSHLFYAQYFGVKVSLWGPSTPRSREQCLKDSTWASYPEALDVFLSEATTQRAEIMLAKYRVHPCDGLQDLDSSSKLLGVENKMSPAQMRDCFGWALSCGGRRESRKQTYLMAAAIQGWYVLMNQLRMLFKRCCGFRNSSL